MAATRRRPDTPLVLCQLLPRRPCRGLSVTALASRPARTTPRPPPWRRGETERSAAEWPGRRLGQWLGMLLWPLGGRGPPCPQAGWLAATAARLLVRVVPPIDWRHGSREVLVAPVPDT